MRYFKFDDNSIGKFPIDYKFIQFKPIAIYLCDNLGFGYWINL